MSSVFKWYNLAQENINMEVSEVSVQMPAYNLKHTRQIIVLKDIRFNVLGNYIINKGKKIFLTQIENKLLYFFCNNYEMRISSNEIVDYLQEYSKKVIYTEQNIYVHINRLRKKMEIIPSHPEILINIRPGYMLDIIPVVIEEE